MNPQEVSTDVSENSGSGQVVELDFYDYLGDLFGGSGSGVDAAGLIGTFGSVWNVWTVFAYLFSALCVYGFAYASIRKAELEAVQREGYQLQEKLYQRTFGGNVKNQRWQEVKDRLDSENPNDWKLAIIEADVLLDETIKERGYAGTTLGERLKSISPAHLQSLDDAWDAHRIRNRVAHEGADFVLTQKLARNTITQYQRVFEELGVA